MSGGSGKDEDDVLWRLLKCFEEGVECADGKHVYFIDNVYFVFCLRRGESDGLFELADIVDAGIGCCVDFDDVERFVFCEGDALSAFEAWLGALSVGAIDGLGKESGESGLSGSSRSGEEIGMSEAVMQYGVAESFDDVLLADDV